MIVVVNDANILIDLVKLDLLPHFFGLQLAVHTTNLVLEELSSSQQLALQKYIDDGQLAVHACNDQELLQIGFIGMNRPALSTQDCSALWLAQNLSALLITSDNKLRSTAKAENLDVHGHFWVFDRMYEAGLLTGSQAAEKLNELCSIVNTKLELPRKEIEKRNGLWNL